MMMSTAYFLGADPVSTNNAHGTLFPFLFSCPCSAQIQPDLYLHTKITFELQARFGGQTTCNQFAVMFVCSAVSGEHTPVTTSNQNRIWCVGIPGRGILGCTHQSWVLITTAPRTTAVHTAARTYLVNVNNAIYGGAYT